MVERVEGQNLPFPYDIQVETVAGNCFDDSRAIITLWDAFGNEVVIDTATHHAANTAAYPLYNVQYLYRNQTAGTNTRYDSLNNIQLSAGTYCFGVVGYVPVTNGGVTTYELVDTTLCGIAVPTHYNHLEASVLSGIAENNSLNYGEKCGLRGAFECLDCGRIQLKLRYGNFPYRVQLYDENNQLVRDRYFFQRQHNGTDSTYANYMDFYTFDSLPAGDYRIIASDSCGYNIQLFVNVPLNNLNSFRFRMAAVGTDNIGIHCADTNVLCFAVSSNWSFSTHNYDDLYRNNRFIYRFINPDGDTTQWKSWILSSNPYIYDTIRSADRLCDLLGDTIIIELWDKCREELYDIQFVIANSGGYYFGSNQSTNILEPIVSEGDTCGTNVYSGRFTETYELYGRAIGHLYGGITFSESGTYTVQASNQATCPLSLSVYTEHDEQLLAYDENNRFTSLSVAFTNPSETDTTIVAHIVLRDAKGCVLNEYYSTYEFTIIQIDPNYADYEYALENDPFTCWYDRHFYIREKDVDFYRFRHNVTVQMIESPLYNHFNFTATYHDNAWDIVMEDPTNTSTNVEFSIFHGWRFRISDHNLPTGRYRLVSTTECGTDTLTYIFTSPGIHDKILAFDVEPQFPGVQICDRYYVTPYSVGALYEYSINVNVSNDEPIISRSTRPVTYTVISGPTSGWYYSNNQIVFTIPGDYVIQSDFQTTEYVSCTHVHKYHYDTVTYEPIYIDFDMGYAVICDAETSTGNVLTHAINGTQPYQYYLYDHADLDGNLLGTSTNGNFYDIALAEGQQVSVLAIDSCQNSFSINMVVTSLSQSTLAWETGYSPGEGHCEGDSAFLTALPFTQSVTYHWTGPNGFASDERDNTVLLPYGSESGWYTVEITNTGCQTAFSDSVYIEVLRAPTIDILSDTTLCAGSEIELALVAQSNGEVHYTLHHSGAPQSGEVSFTAQSGDTLHYTFPILGDNLFWVTDAMDERCAYHHTIDTTRVLVYGAEPDATSDLNTVDGFACYGYEAIMQASSTLTTPYYINWYASPRQDTLLQRDTIRNAAQAAAYSIPDLLHDTVLYVTLSNAGRCENLYGAIYHSINMNGGTVGLQSGEGARFFDSGGEYGNYSNNEQLTQTFCTDADGLRLMFHALEVLAGDTLFVYEGAAADPAHLAAVITHSLYPPELATDSSCITFRFSSNWVNVGSGWCIDILTDAVMTEVYAHIIPPYADTVTVEVCQSETPYTLGRFDNLDLSVPGLYRYDSLFIATNGCDSTVHLELLVKPVSDTILYDSTQYSHLPYTWNGAVFNDFGEQEVTFTNVYHCDSVVHLVLTWTPALELTYDTVVCESDLPFEWHGTTFTAADTVTIGTDTLITLQLGVFSPHLSVSPDVTIRTGDTAALWVSGADHYL